MNEFHFPWLELAVLIPLLGAAWMTRVRDYARAQRDSMVVCGLALCCALGAWLEFGFLSTGETGGWLLPGASGGPVLAIDELSAPLLPLASLVYLLATVSTMRTKLRRFSFAGMLVSEAILLATFSCLSFWGIIGLLALGTLPPFLELRARGASPRVYLLHMGLSIALLIAGGGLVSMEGNRPVHSLLAVGLLTAGVLIRSGVAPVHCWISDLFEKATFGTALLFVTPMVGVYAAIRLVLPIASDPVLRCIAMISLFTAVYAAGMSLIQREARRYFCYVFLSHSSLVLVGIETATPVSLTGALSLWMSVGLSLAGFGLTLRSMEARTGRISLDSYRGLYDHTPRLAALFLLTGLASVGFPGTFGFVGTELLVDGEVQLHPFVGTFVVVAAALNGIAIIRAYFLIFTGTRHMTSVPLRSRLPERLAILALAGLILGGGLFPQPGIISRHRAAQTLVKSREALARAIEAESRSALAGRPRAVARE